MSSNTLDYTIKILKVIIDVQNHLLICVYFLLSLTNLIILSKIWKLLKGRIANYFLICALVNIFTLAVRIISLIFDYLEKKDYNVNKMKIG